MSDIDQILYPSLLTSFREDIPPVQCIVWKGYEEFENIVFEKVYPFDTIDEIKRMICTYYENDPHFIPKYTFIGFPVGDDLFTDSVPSLEMKYISLDYLWYKTGENDPKKTWLLNHPLKTLKYGDDRFITSTGEYSSPNYEPRGRSTLEDIFLKNYDGKIPTFHVFSLYHLLREYSGPTPISEEDWNKRFAPYFPNVSINGPYEPTSDDLEYAEKIHFFVKQRDNTLNILEDLVNIVEFPDIRLNGIRLLRLSWNKNVKGFEGCGSLFYRIPVTDIVPFMRLIPAEGTPLTKIHVKGVLPIPTLDDPRVLEQWGREISATPGFDYCYLKYIQRKSEGLGQSIYGTVRIFNDGTLDLIIQPPKTVKKLDPIKDFREFKEKNINEVFKYLHQPFDIFKLSELSAILYIRKAGAKFNKKKLQQRLPLFQNFFQEISPLPDESPIISLRYKAVSQYATEGVTFSFLTQYATKKILQGEANEYEMVLELQKEFQLSKLEAKSIVNKWMDQKGKYTLQTPDDGEFIESYNSGVDIHIYAQHPSYFFHVNNVDSIETLRRIYTLLSLLFVSDDEYFAGASQLGNEMAIVGEEIENNEIREEEREETPDRPTAVNASATEEIKQEEPQSAVDYDATYDFLLDQVDFGETNPENIPDAVNQLTNPVEEERPTTNISKMQKQVYKENKKEITNKEIEQPVSKDTFEQKLVDPKSWFIKKLQEIDNRLFSFKTDKSENGYSRKCAGNDDRQPSVLTQDQYDRMLDVYNDDIESGEIYFIVYPWEGAQDPIIPSGAEVYSLVKFGSDSDNINYYFCPEYYCLSCELMIRPKIFEQIHMCPFCHGGLIEDKKKAIPGKTVYRRKEKPMTDKVHTYVDFLSKSTHPENLALPCCFIKTKTLRVTDPQFAHIKDFLEEKQLEELDEDQIEDAEIEAEQEEQLNMISNQNVSEYEITRYNTYQYDAIEYAVLFNNLSKQYILESNKHPGNGIFATIPREYDTFFSQDSDKLVTRVAVQLRLRPTSEGFLRIGTDTSVTESILGVLVPIMGKNSINEVKQRIIEYMTPNIFISANFGNLVLEFYDPSDTTANANENYLRQWASSYDLVIDDILALKRVFNSYTRFQRFINDPTKRKDLRHIQPLLAEPGLYVDSDGISNGLQLIVMEKNEEGVIKIKCPPYGVSLERHQKTSFAFISKEMKELGNIMYAKYELYFYTINTAAKGGQIAIHNNILVWRHKDRKDWPGIVKERIKEYMTQCQTKYRTIYTAQSGVNSLAMIPLSRAIEILPNKPFSIIRDNYNHVIGLSFLIRSSRKQIALPLVDDGYIASINRIQYGWDSIQPAYADDIAEYYKSKFEDIFSLYPGYVIDKLVKQKDITVGLQLKNGLIIPASEPKSIDNLRRLGVTEQVSINEFEWEVNKKLTESCGVDPELKSTFSYKKMEEIYQQFRLIFSNWITSINAGSTIRKDIENIIFNSDLPEYEKRKRLDILIGSDLLKWFYADEEKWEWQPSLLRKDCRVIDSPEQCSGTCYWNQEGDSGKCLLHVDAETNLGDRYVSTPNLFIKRVIDELVRFPARRKQILKKGSISKVSIIIEPIRQGDQYIIPESSPTWTNLLRLDWAREIPEEKRFYEEMSREKTDENMVKIKGELPQILKKLLGEDTIFSLWRPKPNTKNPLIGFTPIFELSLEQLGLSMESTQFTRENLVNFVKQKKKPIGYIDFSVDSEHPKIEFIKPSKDLYEKITIIVNLPDGAGLLIENIGDPTVTISNLPENILEHWVNASFIRLMKIAPREENIPKEIDYRTRKIRASEKLPAKQDEIIEIPVEEKPELKEAPKKIKKPIIGTRNTRKIKRPIIQPKPVLEQEPIGLIQEQTENKIENNQTSLKFLNENVKRRTLKIKKPRIEIK